MRYIINMKTFEKRSNPQFSKQTHKIVEANEHSYKLDNGRTYKYYQLQPVGTIEKIDKEQTLPTREQVKRNNTVKQNFKKSGLLLSDILPEVFKRTMIPKRN